MKISLLADCPNEAPKVALWYFNEWAHNVPDATFNSITKKVSLGANRDALPTVFVVHIENELVGAG